MLLITLLSMMAVAAPAESAGPTGSVGLYGAVVGLHEAATHDIRFAGGAWLENDLGPGNGSLDLYVARGFDRGTGYSFHTANVRLAALYGWSGGRRMFDMHFGVGPGVAARVGNFEASGEKTPIFNVEPALRARMGLIGPIAGPIAATWHMGLTARPGGVDYDAGLGLGVWW